MKEYTIELMVLGSGGFPRRRRFIARVVEDEVDNVFDSLVQKLKGTVVE